MKKYYLIIVILLITIISAFSLEIFEGRIKLVLHENSSSFSVFYLDEINSGKYIPLLFEKDPETTFLSLMVDNKIYKMGGSSGFSSKVVSGNSGGSIIWESKKLKISEHFSFLKSNTSSLSDGIIIAITVENLSEQNSLIGINYLFDTYLGEKDNKHFVLDNGSTITSESSYSSQFPSLWISPSGTTNIKGLVGMIRGPGITVPDKIVFANWKRLQDNIWNFQDKQSRNFNFLPYSINDSAVSVTFNPIKVSSKSSREIVIVLGGYNENTFKISSASGVSGIDAIFNQTINTGNDPQNTESSVRSDLIATTDLISKIDTLLQFPENVTDGEIDLIMQILDTLNQRQKLYEER